jgi:hypothetical protein
MRSARAGPKEKWDEYSIIQLESLACVQFVRGHTRRFGYGEYGSKALQERQERASCAAPNTVSFQAHFFPES